MSTIIFVAIAAYFAVCAIAMLVGCANELVHLRNPKEPAKLLGFLVLMAIGYAYIAHLG